MLDEDRIPTKILKAKPEGKISAGRPEARWLTADRSGWTSMFEKAINGL